MMIHAEADNSSRVDLKKRIVATSMEAFSSRGVKSVTMDEIAMMLGISKRTLYEVFEDKETLLIECLLTHRAKMNAFVDEVLANSSNVLEVILKCYKKSIEDYQRTNIRFFKEVKKYPKVNELIDCNRKREREESVEFFEKGVAQGLFRSDVNFDIIHTLVYEQLDLLLSSELFARYSFMEVYEAIIFTFLRGVSTEKGDAILEKFIIEHRDQNKS